MTNKPPIRAIFAAILFIACVLAAGVSNAAHAQAPSDNGITSPAEGAAVSGVVEVSGVATDPAFQKWQIDLLVDGKAQKATAIAVGTEAAASPAPLTTFDSSRYPNGNHRLRLRVVRRDGNYDEYFRGVTLANPITTDVEVESRPTPAATEANGITSPAAGEKVEGTVRIRGIADDPDFLKWQLDLLLGGDPKQVFPITVSRTPAPKDRNLGAVDTQYLENGQHVLRLRVVRQDSNFDEYRLPVVTDNPGAPLPLPVAENGFTAPRRNARVEGVIDIHGVAKGPAFNKWQIDLLLDGEPEQAVFVALGRRPVLSSTLMARFNTETIPNGEHVLRLRVVRGDGNYDEYVRPIRVENPD